MSGKVTAQELKNIRLSYEMAITDYSACTSAKELEYWADCAECSIDQHVQTLDREVSKQNQALLKEVGEAYQRLQLKLDAQRKKATYTKRVTFIHASKQHYNEF
jgi:allophanate hydrolase subunit 1